MLSRRQIAQYRKQGYLAVETLLDRETVAALGRATDAFVERSRPV